MEARKHLAMSNAQEKEKNKENLDEGKNGHTKLAKPRAFVDRQDTAERVSWDESQESTSQVQAAHTGKKPTRSVRQAEDEEQIPDPSEDEGFQSNTGVVDVRKRGGAAPTAHRKNTVPAKRRPSIEPPPPQREKSQGDVDENDVVELYSRSAPSRSQADIAAEQKNANLLAKFQVRTRAPAKAQTRRPWTEDETSTLIENIVEHGTSYTLIKTLDDARDQVLQGRDQGALKDKARNIKTDYLK